MLRPCPKCGGLYGLMVEVGCVRMKVWRCLVCGFRRYPSGPIPVEDSFDGAITLLAVMNAEKVDHMSLPLARKIALEVWDNEWRHIPPELDSKETGNDER